MDAYEIVNALNQILDLGDSLDDTGVVGVRALTNGEHTTREAIRLELSQFLLYIANGNSTLEDGEVALRQHRTNAAIRIIQQVPNKNCG